MRYCLKVLATGTALRLHPPQASKLRSSHMYVLASKQQLEKLKREPRERGWGAWEGPKGYDRLRQAVGKLKQRTADSCPLRGLVGPTIH